MQPAIRRDHFLACRYACRRSTAAASNAGHLTTNMHHVTRTVRILEGRWQTELRTQNPMAATEEEAPGLPATPTWHGTEAAGSRYRPPCTRARRLPTPRCARPNSGNWQAISPCTNVWPSQAATNLCSCMVLPTGRNSTSLFEHFSHELAMHSYDDETTSYSIYRIVLGFYIFCNKNKTRKLNRWYTVCSRALPTT